MKYKYFKTHLKKLSEQMNYQLHRKRVISGKSDNIIQWEKLLPNSILHDRITSDEVDLMQTVDDLHYHLLSVSLWNKQNEWAWYHWPNENNIMTPEEEMAQFSFDKGLGLGDYGEPLADPIPIPFQESKVAKLWMKGLKVFKTLKLSYDEIYVATQTLPSGKIMVVDIPQVHKVNFDTLAKYNLMPLTTEMIHDYLSQLINPQKMLKQTYLFDWSHYHKLDLNAMQVVANQL